MAAADQSTGWFHQIWFVSYPAGRARKVTNDPNNYMGARMSRDSNVLLTLQSDWLSNIWTAPDGDSDRAAPITTGKYEGMAGIAWAKGAKIVYGTRDWDIWIMDEDGNRQRLLTIDEHSNRRPAVSPDGGIIFFDSWRKGHGIWRMGVDGGDAKQLTAGYDIRPDCSPDGRWVFYQSQVKGRDEIWKVGAEGGASSRWTGKLSGLPSISPDGKRIAWGASDFTICVADLDFSGPEAKVVNRRDAIRSEKPLETYHVDWSPDAKYLTFSRGPQQKKKLGAAPEMIGAQAEGWDIWVADASATNRWTAITSNGKSNKEPDWAPARKSQP